MAYFQGLWLLVSGRVDLIPDLNSLPFSFSILCFVNWFSRDMEPYFETCPFSKELTNKERPSHPFKKYPLHFFSMGRILLRWKGHTMKFFPWKLTNVFLKMDFVGSDYSFPFEMVPWKSLATIFDRLVFEFHHYFSRGENQHPEGSLTFLKWWVDFQRKKTRSFFKGGYEDLVKLQRAQHFFPPPKF